MQADISDMAMDEDLRANPLAMMLVAMLADQIQTLGYLHRRGMWRSDPRELGDWLRAEAEDPKNGRDTFMKEVVVREWVMWTSSGAEALIEALSRETLVVIDRGRIVRLAMAYSSQERAADNTRRRELHRERRKVVNARRESLPLSRVQVANARRDA